MGARYRPVGALITIPAGHSLPTCMGNHSRPGRGNPKPGWGKDDKPVRGPLYRPGVTTYHPRGDPPAQSERSLYLRQCRVGQDKTCKTSRETIKTVKISLWRLNEHENRQNVAVEGKNSKTSHLDMKTFG